MLLLIKNAILKRAGIVAKVERAGRPISG